MNISGFGQDEIHAACAAAAGPCFRYSDWSRAATDVKSPNAVNMIQATRLLAVDAVLRAERGDIRGALEECRAGMRLTRLSMDEPILITTLVAIADMKILLVAFNRIVCGRDVDPNLLADWMKDLDTHSWRARFERCVTAERIFTLEFELEVIGGDLGGRGGFSRGERLFYWLSRPVRKAEIIWLQLLEAFDPLFPWDPGWAAARPFGSR